MRLILDGIASSGFRTNTMIFGFGNTVFSWGKIRENLGFSQRRVQCLFSFELLLDAGSVPHQCRELMMRCPELKFFGHIFGTEINQGGTVVDADV